jgi:diguanylate cyclase (GGDEF)-like protein
MGYNVSSNTSAKPPSAIFLMLAGIAIAIGFSAISASVFREMGQQQYDHAYNSAVRLVASIAANVDRNVELYDLSLRQASTAATKAAMYNLDGEARRLALFDGSAGARGFGAMRVLNERGRVVADSSKSSPAVGDFSDRDFFRVHQMDKDTGLFISSPWVTEEGEHVISLSRRISQPDGSFGGVVVGNVSLAYFHDLFRNLQLGPEVAVALLSTDGTVLMRQPFSIAMIGTNIGSRALLANVAQTSTGYYRSISAVDGIEKLFVYQQIGKLPLIAVQGISMDAIFAGWWREIWLLGALLLILSILTLGLIFSLASALKRRHAAETRLAILAATDSLTGLSNRRRFDEALDSEWRRGLRSKTAVALILIDVDHFKSYNDAFGHQAGDAALATVAKCISESARRAGDLCARYGGEEFAVLLPEVDMEGAIQVAEKIRARVLAEKGQHLDGANRVPTVSLGVASMSPNDLLSASDLVKSADLALYDAKRDGRNRTVSASILQFPRRAPALARAS